MQIQINTGHNIQNSEAMVSKFTDVLQSALERFSDRITHVETYFGDENAQKGGPEGKRCTIEARLEGLEPLTVTDHGATPDRALKGAADKMVHLLGSTLGKLRDEDQDRRRDAKAQNLNGE